MNSTDVVFALVVIALGLYLLNANWFNRWADRLNEADEYPRTLD